MREHKDVNISFSLKSFEDYKSLNSVLVESNKTDSPDYIIIQMRTIIYLSMINFINLESLIENLSGVFKNKTKKPKKIDLTNQRSVNEWMIPASSFSIIKNTINVLLGILFGKKRKAEKYMLNMFNSLSENSKSLPPIYVIGIFNSSFSKLLNSIYNRLNLLLIASLKNSPIRYINVYDKLNESETNGVTVQFPDKHHYNAEAHKIIANSLIKVFSKEL